MHMYIYMYVCVTHIHKNAHTISCLQAPYCWHVIYYPWSGRIGAGMYWYLASWVLVGPCLWIQPWSNVLSLGTLFCIFYWDNTTPIFRIVSYHQSHRPWDMVLILDIWVLDIYAYLYMFLYMYICLCIYMFVYVYTQTLVYVYTQTLVYVHIATFFQMPLPFSFIIMSCKS